MTSITFDTLRLAQRLRDEAKYSPEQAEKVAAVLSDTFGDWQERQQVATKTDLRELELRIIVKLGGMIAVFAGFMTAIKYLG